MHCKKNEVAKKEKPTDERGEREGERERERPQVGPHLLESAYKNFQNILGLVGPAREKNTFPSS